MTERVVRLGLCIEAGSEADAEELAGLAVGLRERLLELDVDSADPAAAGQAPLGTRAGEIFVAGALTVMLALSKKLLTALTETVQSWVTLSSRRSVKPRRDQRELVQAWIDRHTDR